MVNQVYTHDYFVEYQMTHYEIRPSTQERKVVECQSEKRLPYEPREWQLEQKKELSEALKKLEARSDETLAAQYFTPTLDRFDIENILFYNIGSGSFKKAARYGLEFEMASSSVLEDSMRLLHCHRYELQPTRKVGFIQWKTLGNPMRMRVECTEDHIGDIKTATIWYAMKTNCKLYEPIRILSENSKFTLSVTITRKKDDWNLASVVKPIFDGVISAFHSYKGNALDEVSKRLVPKLYKDQDDIKRFLEDDHQALLGKRTHIHPRGDGVQWNPQDDNCVAGALYLDIDEQINSGFILDIALMEVER